ncbi:hypothetical protein RCL1_008476 [Eukaryota sp. TZLM3-RCL]
MSRIFIRGIPDTCNESTLRKHFESCGRITDLKVITSSSGKSRRIAFIGFFSEEEASNAVKHMNNAFIGMAKISVEIAKPDGDPDLPRPWSRYTKEKTTEAGSKRTSSSEEPTKKKRDLNDVRRELWTKSLDGLTPESIAENGIIFLRNLSYSITESDLRTLLEPFGELSDLSLPIDQTLGRPRGFAIATYLFPKDAVTAFSALDNSLFQGRVLHVLPGKPVTSSNQNRDQQSKIDSFKKVAEDLRKSQAGSSHNWNSLFVRSDTAVNAMVTSSHVSKEDFLGENGAIRQTLAENAAVTESKEVLKSHGINLDSLINRDCVERSTTIILVKNLPFDCTDDEISELFSKYGMISFFVVTPNKSLAIIEMGDASQAKRAFSKLAYKKFKGQPIYLEYAPIGIKNTAHNNQSNLIESVVDGEESETVFIKNLPLTTTEQELANYLSQIFVPRSVSIAKKRTGESLGFGFAEFKTRPEATQIILKLNNSNFEGNILKMEYSTKPTSSAQNSGMKSSLSAVKPKDGDSNTKILVRNIPFEANKKELKELFTAFGELKTFRAPKKIDGSLRGFCFVEYVSSDEALRAFESLSAVHFYGRHLVLEWSKEDDSLNLEAAEERNERREEKRRGKR